MMCSCEVFVDLAARDARNRIAWHKLPNEIKQLLTSIRPGRFDTWEGEWKDPNRPEEWIARSGCWELAFVADKYSVEYNDVFMTGWNFFFVSKDLSAVESAGRKIQKIVIDVNREL